MFRDAKPRPIPCGLAKSLFRQLVVMRKPQSKSQVIVGFSGHSIRMICRESLNRRREMFDRLLVFKSCNATAREGDAGPVIARITPNRFIPIWLGIASGMPVLLQMLAHQKQLVARLDFHRLWRFLGRVGQENTVWPTLGLVDQQLISGAVEKCKIFDHSSGRNVDLNLPAASGSQRHSLFHA